MIVLHTDLLDEEIKKAVREAVQGEITALTREALSNVVQEEVARKVGTITPGNEYIQRITREQLKEQVRELIRNEILSKYAGEGVLKDEYRKVVKEVVREILSVSLRNIA